MALPIKSARSKQFWSHSGLRCVLGHGHEVIDNVMTMTRALANQTRIMLDSECFSRSSFTAWLLRLEPDAWV